MNKKLQHITKGLFTVHFLHINSMEKEKSELLNKVSSLVKTAKNLLTEIKDDEIQSFANLSEEDQATIEGQKYAQTAALLEDIIYSLEDVVENIPKAIED